MIYKNKDFFKFMLLHEANFIVETNLLFMFLNWFLYDLLFHYFGSQVSSKIKKQEKLSQVVKVGCGGG